MDAKGRVQGNQISISFEGHQVLEAMRFSPANLADAQPPKFESPPLARALARDLYELRMLVLGGHGLSEKVIFARHLAWYLSDSIPGYREKPSLSNGIVPVKQWLPSVEPQNPEEALRELTEPTVLLFAGILPQHLGYDLSRLYEAVSQHKHYAILTTDSTLPQWGIQERAKERRFWRDLPPSEIYGPDYLSSLLERELKGLVHLPAGLCPEGCGADRPLVAGLTVHDAAVRLETPSRIQAFVNLLRAEPAPVRPEAVEELLQQLQGDQQAARRWYRRLDTRKQLLCLGLTLFDGLFDDQVFAALETLVGSVWRDQEPLLAHFDYHELPGVEAYFHGTEGGSRTTRIESFSQSHRRALLGAAWDLHRRRILNTLPVLAQMMTRSVDRRAAARERREEGRSQQLGRVLREGAANLAPDRRDERDSQAAGEAKEATNLEEARLSGWQAHGTLRELFGSETRRLQLRRATAETLSQIGLHSLDAVEPNLLELASDPAREVQVVAAVAVARWRDPETGPHNELLFETLRRWQDEAFVLEASLGHRRRVADPFAHVRATVALATSYAAQYDQPNQLAAELREIVEKLVGDTNPIVRDRFRSQTLPLVVAAHVQQLESFVRRDVVLWVDLLEGVAVGLAAACLLQPEAALAILDRWYRECLAETSTAASDDELTVRETTLATVALAYGSIESDRAREVLTPAEIFERLKRLLAAEDHPFVRSAVLSAMILQARQDFQRSEPLMQDLVAEVALEERPFVVKRLTELYLAQRRALQGGDDGLFVDDRRYPVWTASQRPLTGVEEALYRWLQGSERPEAQQVAVQAFASFNETQLERRERSFLAERANAQQTPENAPAAAAPQARTARQRMKLHPVSFLGRAAIWLATLRAPSYREILQAVFPEVQEGLREGLSPEQGDERSRSLLERWGATSQEETRDLAVYLRRALSLYRHRWRILAASAGVLLVALIAIGVLLSRP